MTSIYYQIDFTDSSFAKFTKIRCHSAMIFMMPSSFQMFHSSTAVASSNERVSAFMDMTDNGAKLVQVRSLLLSLFSFE